MAVARQYREIPAHGIAPVALDQRTARDRGGQPWGVYILLAAATVLEQSFSGTPYADDVGQYLPFFEDISSITHIKGLSASIAEIFMLLLLIGLLLKRGSDRTFRFDKGSLMRPLSLYIGMVVVAEIIGVATGGNVTTSLWEVRGQVYLFVAYVLTCNLVKTRRQVTTLVGIVAAGAGVKAIQGLWRYLITLGGNTTGIETLFPHEQAFFFNAGLTLTPILFLYGGSRRLKWFGLALLPIEIVVTLANKRRAAFLALAVGFAVMLLITAVTQPARRRLVISIVVVATAIWFPYSAAFKNSGGLTGEVARAFTSASSPNSRDQSSNAYRINEDKDIMATMRSSTLSTVLGYGFGKPMSTPYPLADISAGYIFWNIMPHDSILWVWMRLGTVGYLLLWMMIAGAIVQATALARRLADPFLRGVAVWIVCMIVQQIILSYLDLQWDAYRNMITVGVLFAVISRLSMVSRGGVSSAPQGPRHVDQQRSWPRRPDLPRSLAVVEGRLIHRVRRFPDPSGSTPGQSLLQPHRQD